MLATIALVLGGFAFAVVRAWRRGNDTTFAPSGKLRWTDEPS
jgi:hypothetical protein